MMYSLKFELPYDKKIRDQFLDFQSKFKREQAVILHSLNTGIPLQWNGQLERHVWDDLVTVVSGIKATPNGTFQDWSLWSFHRNTPQWGNPLFGLLANDDEKTLFLRLIISDDWTDEYEINSIILFKCINSLQEINDSLDMLMSSDGIDYWVKIYGDYLEVFFVIVKE